MSVNRRNPLYAEIREDIKNQIAAGKMAIGDRIPSTSELKQHYGVSAITVRRAVEDLVRDGILVGHQGAGVYVKDDKPCSGADDETYIGLIVRNATYVTGNYFSQILAGLSTAVSSKKYGVQVGENAQDESVLHYRSVMEEGKTAGFVVADQYFSFADAVYLKSHDTPFVLVDETIAGVEACSVSLDYAQGVRDACGYLHSLGHERIALLLSSISRSQDFQFLRGYQQGMEDLSLPVDESLVKFSQSMELDARPFAERIIAECRAASDPPTAAICNVDMVAVEVMHAARKSGVAVPEQLSVVGFNDAGFQGLERPGLTRLVANLSHLGKEAAEMLIQLIEHKRPPRSRLLLPMTLEPAGTTAARTTGPQPRHQEQARR